MQRVYLETSFISYLTSRLSRNLIVAGHQQITQDWWANRRSSFELYVSRIVIDEASVGDEQAVQSRLAILRSLSVLQMTREAVDLARNLTAAGVFPSSAAEDALHVAIATVHGMDFLLTWNCRHIANAEVTRAAREICVAEGFQMPIICTPEELLGG